MTNYSSKWHLRFCVTATGAMVLESAPADPGGCASGGAGKQVTEPGRLLMKVGLGHGFGREDVLPRDRPARGGIIWVAGHDVGVQMRNCVPKGHVIHLDRLKLHLHRASYGKYFVPVLTRLIGIELGRLGDVFMSPGHDAVAGQAAAALQEHLSRFAGDDVHPGIVVALAERRAHQAVLTGHLFVPVVRPSALGHGAIQSLAWTHFKGVIHPRRPWCSTIGCPFGGARATYAAG